MKTSDRDERITIQAAALYVAASAYSEALRMATPAATLDRMIDVVHEITPDVCKVVSIPIEFTDALRGSITERLKAFAAIEHTRAEAGEGYGYVFDLLADSLRAGSDAHVVRTTALDVPRRIRELAEAAS